MKYSHYYACPYCEEAGNKTGYLKIIKDLNVSCDHKEGWFAKHKECRKEDFACKEILDCAECGAGFKYDKEFLDKQRRINKNNNNK